MVTPTYKPFCHLEGEQPRLGDLLSMVINPLLSGMILKLGVLYKPGVCHCICRMPLELNSLRCHRVVFSTKISFSPLFGEESHFDQYFSDGLRPPTSSIFQSLSEEHFSRGKKHIRSFNLEQKSPRPKDSCGKVPKNTKYSNSGEFFWT